MEADRRFEEAARMAAESNLTEISDYISTQKEQRKHYPDRFAHLPTKEFILQDSRATGAPSVTADIIAAIPDPMTGLRPPLQTSANPVAGASQAEQAIPNANGSYASQAQEEPLPEIEIIGPAEETGSTAPPTDGPVIEAEPNGFSVYEDQPPETAPEAAPAEAQPAPRGIACRSLIGAPARPASASGETRRGEEGLRRLHSSRWTPAHRPRPRPRTTWTSDPSTRPRTSRVHRTPDREPHRR